MSILSTETEENSNGALIIEIKRTAIDSSGQLGSLYDGCRDRLVGQLNVNNQENLYPTHKTVLGEIKYGNDDQPQNLLRMLSINEQLRLSIVLKLTPSIGIAALIEYPNLTNEYTRFFCYSYVDRVQRLSDQMAKQIINSSILSIPATHIITGIESGIDLIVVLQLPSDANIVKEIDHILDKLLTVLLDDDMAYTLTPNEENLLERIVYTKVYANTPDINKLIVVHDVCRYIKENTNRIITCPISYTLQPIKWLYPQYHGVGATFIPLSQELSDKIEEYVLQLTADLKKLEISVTEDMPKLLCEHLKERVSNVQKQFLDAKDKFTNEIERLSNLVIEFRSGRTENLVIQQAFTNSEQMMIKNRLNDVIQNLENLKEKDHFISNLIQDQFQYLNVVERGIDQTDNGITIGRKLVKDNQHNRILCSNDYLNKNNAEQLQKLRSDLVEELKNNSNLRLIYADFSYCSFELSNMMILPSPKETTHENVSDHTSSPSSPIAQTSLLSPTELQISISPSTNVDIPNAPSSPMPVSADETINILLLGETGVGKSTFINAFANYLTFNTLQEAQSGKPIVLIPVSFLTTVGHNFEEHIVKFGDVDDENNEDFNHPGQSVTQRCNSYVFNLNHYNGKKLCIIDSPGFGDTRGLNQDDYNMRHILEYIKTLPYLNAICFLLKPNEARLNIFYRSCLLQLFSLLGQNNDNNIIFCFTNARSTFYTPGDTAPLLKNMLTSLPMDNVQFKKDNTFCFDSESFRYLVALQNGISFSDLEKEEYEMSWTKSVTASNRLIYYISEELPVHRMHDE